MSSPWTELLFLHGHVADPQLARRLVEEATDAGGSGGKRQRRPVTETSNGAEPSPLAAGMVGPLPLAG